jgi:Uma2 family endonuclease
MDTVRILDVNMAFGLIQDRQTRGIDLFDEVWEGVYVVPPLANLPHQDLVADLTGIMYQAINMEDRGKVQAGANVSDRRIGWEHNFRAPDVVVVLKNSRAVNCETHWLGGPDFLIEIQSPGDETELKIPFYSQIQVRELLIIHRDSRHLRLFRHDGQQLVLVQPSPYQAGKWLVSEVVPFAFRPKVVRRKPRTQVHRTDGQPGSWTV